MVDPAIKATSKSLGGAERRRKPSSPSIDRHNLQKQNHSVWYLRSDLKLAAMREWSCSSSKFDFPDTYEYAFQTKHALEKHPSPGKTYYCSLTHLFDNITVPVMAQMIVAACMPRLLNVIDPVYPWKDRVPRDQRSHTPYR